MKRILVLIAVLLMLIVIAYGVINFTQLFRRNNTILPKVNLSTEEEVPVEEIPRVSVIAENLSIPWALAFLPDKRIIFTERNGEIKIIDNGNVREVASINVHAEGEGGLHGIAIDPDFEQNNYIYIYYTTKSSGENSTNRVSRYTFDDNSLRDETILVDNIPGATIHDGGRIKFGPDNYLYIATGDAAEPSLAQNTNSIAGKILRVDRNGKAAPGNPFGNLIYSLGHRNPQGLAWDESGQLFGTEHGNSATDEFNRIEPGDNYGWPTIRGSERRDGMQSPLIQSANSTWAPAGLAYIDGKFYFGGLRGNALFQVEQVNGEFTLTEYFKGEYGRIRDVVVGPDKMLYITTSNRDGRGVPSENDDKIIRVNPFLL